MQRDFFRKVDTGFETMQIVQVDQKFLYHKPMLAGDKVWGRMEVISVNERFGADIVQTRNLALDENGELYLEAFTTLMGHEGDDSVSLKYDLESGQVMRTAASGGRAKPRRRRPKAGLVTRTCADVHSDLGIFPIKRAVRRFLIDRTGSAQIV